MSLLRRPFEPRSSSSLSSPLERRDLALQAGAVAVGVEVIPGREQTLGDVESPLAELLLGGEPLGVGGQVADQVRPAGLAALWIEAAVGPPAIGADDALEVLAEQGRRLALVAVGGDAKDGDLRSDGAPQGALGAAQLPAGLVDVERRLQSGCGRAGPRRAPLSASPARARIASTVPLASLAPNSSPISSTVSRRETRLRIASVATAASMRGPKAPAGTSAGSSARIASPQSGQRRRCRRCSVTSTAISGSSVTWRRAGSPAASSAIGEAVPASAAPRPMLHHPVDRLELAGAFSLCPGGRAGRPASARRDRGACARARPAGPGSAGSRNSGSCGSGGA